MRPRATPALVGAALVVAAAVVAVAVLLARAPDTFVVQLGNLPAWVAAVGTVGTLSAAVAVIYRDRRSRLREQAEKVACWVNLEDSGFELKVSNTSDLPVYKASVHLVSETDTGSYGFISNTIPPQTKQLTSTETNWAVNATWSAIREHREDAVMPTEAVAYLAFQDAAGQGWVRSTEGELWPVTEEERERFVARVTNQPNPGPSGTPSIPDVIEKITQARNRRAPDPEA